MTFLGLFFIIKLRKPQRYSNVKTRLFEGDFMKEKQVSEFQSLAIRICDILNFNNAKDLNLIDVAKSSSIADYFVVCTADSRVQVRALMEELEHELEKDGIFVLRRDGLGDGRWVVLDYGVVIVHIFTADLREFYHIEKLWVDGKNTMNTAAIEKLKEKLQKEKEITEKAEQKTETEEKKDEKPVEKKTKKQAK